MARVEGTLARQLDFGIEPVDGDTAAPRRRLGLKLAVPSAVLRGPDKYNVLEQRRRRAQINARRLLDLID